MNERIRDFYTKTYPDDELGYEMNAQMTFESLYKVLGVVDVYELIGVGDSIVRERLFERLSELLGVDYNVVYNKWLCK